MLCPKCGTENPDAADVCSSCGGLLKQSDGGLKTSGLAVAALVLGICGFFTFGLTALVGLILGIVALSQIQNSAGKLSGRGIAIGGIAASAGALLLVGALVLIVGSGIFAHVDRQVGRARVVTTKATLRLLDVSVNQFRMDTGRFPTEDEGLMALIERPSDISTTWNGGYLETTEIPEDGWGNDFIYESFPASGEPFVIRSCGPDGEMGTDDDLLSTDPY